MKRFSTLRGRYILDGRKQMGMIDVQKLHQRQRVIQVDPQEEVQNLTVQLALNLKKVELAELLAQRAFLEKCQQIENKAQRLRM